MSIDNKINTVRGETEEGKQEGLTVEKKTTKKEYLKGLRDAFQEAYDGKKEPTYAITRKSIVNKLIEELRDRTQAKQVIVLDIGANDQRLEQELFAKLEKEVLPKPHVIASDIIEMSADNSLKEVSTIQTNALDLAILSKKVDIVVSNFTLNYLPIEALKESYRVLKNRGVIICTFHDLGTNKKGESKEERPLNEEEKEKREKFEIGYDRYSVNDNDINKIKKYFKDVGFQNIVVEKKKGEEEGKIIY